MKAGSPSTPESIAFTRALTSRLQHLRGDHTYGYIGDLTGMSSESARRHMLSGNPHVDFLVRLCLAVDCSPDWLFLGRGPMSREQARLYIIEQSPPSLLYGGLGTLLDTLVTEVRRLQLLMQMTPASSLEAKPGALNNRARATDSLKPDQPGPRPHAPPKQPPQ